VSVWEALVLGVVQGATEFLPVSSSGHLVIFQEVLGIHIGGVLFEVVVHVATLVSILLVYRSRVGGLLTGMAAREASAWRYVGLLAVATLPAVGAGLFLRDSIEALFENPVAPGVALLVTGAILWPTRKALARAAAQRPGLWAALLIGVAQAAALIPGISRSGSTVVVALWLGVASSEAAAFSFLMAVPAIAGAAGPGALALTVGGVSAAVTGVLAIRTFVRMLDRRSFHLFAPYCWAVASTYLIYLAVR
jgi:undecaprenyl-diphosphatase